MLPDWMDCCFKCLNIYCECSKETTPQDKQDKEEKNPQCRSKGGKYVRE